MYKNFIVDVEIRLDKFLSLKIDASRNQIEQLIQKEFVKVDGKTTDKNGLKLKLNQEIEVFFPEPKTFDKKNSEFIKESLKDINIEIIYEDSDILIINKPHGLTVHGAPSVKDATLVDWLKLQNFLCHFQDTLDIQPIIILDSSSIHLKQSYQYLLLLSFLENV